MFIFSIYVAMVLIVYAWTAMDEETERTWTIFGHEFRFVWHDSQRWRWMFMYGWRLCAMCCFPIACLLLGLGFVRQVFGTDITFASFATFAAMSLLGVAIIPWLRYQKKRRFWIRVRDCAGAMEGVILDLQTPEANFDNAEYFAEKPWDALHPDDTSFKLPIWKNLMPVVYRNLQIPIGLIQMSSLDTFLLRCDPANIFDVGSTLPFDGPSETKYKVLRSGRLARLENCLLYTSPSPRDATLSRMPSSA